MVPVRIPIALALAGIGLAVGLTSADGPVAERNSIVPTLEYALPKAGFVGSLSCSSASCHNSGDLGKPGGEYSTWAGPDPHSKAFEVLSSPRSQRMVRLLHGSKPGKVTPAYEDATCLNCHSPDLASTKDFGTDTISCETCHGPGEKYLASHFRGNFKSLSAREKAEQFGLYPMKDLEFRITMCAACHVGGPGRDVNHDLIAAGHPRLAFEYTGFHHSYQRHWQESAHGPDFDARAWEIGQVACARIAAEQLARRAKNATGSWPEFAEYSCFACHKDLSNDAWKPHVNSTRSPGALPWGTWYFSTADLAADDEGLPEKVEALAALMERPGRNRTAIAERASELARRFDGRLHDLNLSAQLWSKVRPYDGRQLAAKFDAIAAHALRDGRLRDPDWDGATQHALAASSLYYSWAVVDPKGRDPRPRSALQSLNKSLGFPGGYDSPKNVKPSELIDLFRQLRPDGTK